MPDLTKLRRAYARLKGLERAMPSGATANAELGRDFNKILNDLSQALGEEMDDYEIEVVRSDFSEEFFYTEVFCSKLFQVIALLEQVYHVSTNIVEIGSIFNSIRDEQLKARCADLLSAPSAFDRVINQATLVLEDRIRTKSKRPAGLTGVQLVNDVMKADPKQTVIRFSDDEGEQRGYTDICRGVMAAFRNPTHHQVSDRFSREGALKVCAFIDDLLKVIDDAQVR